MENIFLETILKGDTSGHMLKCHLNSEVSNLFWFTVIESLLLYYRVTCEVTLHWKAFLWGKQRSGVGSWHIWDARTPYGAAWAQDSAPFLIPVSCDGIPWEAAMDELVECHPSEKPGSLTLVPPTDGYCRHLGVGQKWELCLSNVMKINEWKNLSKCEKSL